MRKTKQKNHPPSWAVRFLEWFCPNELLEGIIGDLYEQYEADLKLHSRKATRRFIWNVIRFFHPYILLRNHLKLNVINMGMLKSHLLVSFRNMWKHKGYSLINITGLSLAIAFVFMAFLFINKELSYDQFHKEKDKLHRLYIKIINVESNALKNQSAITPIPLGMDLKNDIAEIKYVSRNGSGSATIKMNNEPFKEVVNFVDPDFLLMFDFPLIAGDKHTALNKPESIILSTEKAEKYFGDNNPIGQTLTINMNDSTFNGVVSGVINNEKSRSSIPFDFLFSMEAMSGFLPESSFTSYNYSWVETYIQTNNNLDQLALETNLTAGLQKYAPADENRLEIGTHKLSEIHLQDEIRGNNVVTSPKKLYIMVALTLLVLVIACINFINLSVSHALGRAKEIGLRKTLGALKSQLRGQLIVESSLVTFVSCIIGSILTIFLLPTFSYLIDTPLIFELDWKSILFILSICLTTGLVSGVFQAVALVKNNILGALRGDLKLKGKNSGFNQSLIVVQFALSMILIIGSVQIRNQMKYIQNKDLGFEEERLLEISLENNSSLADAQLLIDRFKRLAQTNNQVLSVSASMNNSKEPWTALGFSQDDGSNETIYYNQVTATYLPTMGIELLSGANFAINANNDSTAILVNEALVNHFNWENPLAEKIPGKNFSSPHRIVGVVKDFHFSSLHHEIEPLIIALDVKAIESGITGLSTYVWPPSLYQLVVKIGPGEIQPIISHLKSTWEKVNPNEEFVYHFVDEVLENKYAQESRWSNIMDLSSLFAIGIAWLGLLGLMRLSVQKRVKEIGIRKVLGSSVKGIIMLLSKRILLLVLVANLIAWPLSWWLSTRWLESFSYRIELQLWPFTLVGLVVTLFTFLSLSLQSMKVARANPIESINSN